MEIHFSRIPESRQAKLQSWLKDPQLDTLVEVVESKILEHEVEAASFFVGANLKPGEAIPGYELEAKKHAQEAAFLKRFIEKLIEFRDNTQPLKTSTVTPTKRK